MVIVFRIRQKAKPVGDPLTGVARPLPQRAFPDHRHPPSEGGQIILDFPVSGDIRVEFLLPEIGAGRRSRCVAATRVAVPETAMHEQDGMVSGEDQIRAARQTFAVQPESEATGVEFATEEKFGLRIPAADAGHHARTHLRRHDIDHFPCNLLRDGEQRNPSIHNEFPMTSPVSIVDIFSGPGGLGEGFASVQGNDGPAYRLAVSIEKHLPAHATLRLRAFLRRFPELPKEYLNWLRTGGPQPDWSTLYPTDWAAADHETCCLELGTQDASDLLEARIRALEASGQQKTLLIGGPPCQAYSLVGRARNVGIANYDALKDHRNFLYEEYVRVLKRLKPVAFVMENVKGMLSSSVPGRAIFSAVTHDLKDAGYRLFALTPEGLFAAEPGPKDFIVRAEDHGIPQARHRVIVVGIRADVAESLPPHLAPRLAKAPAIVTVRQTIGHLPRLRSGLSSSDDAAAWTEAVLKAVSDVETSLAEVRLDRPGAFSTLLNEVRGQVGNIAMLGRSSTRVTAPDAGLPPDLSLWLAGRTQGMLTLHETRGHMPSDLARYLFAACHGQVNSVSPRAEAFPVSLAPAHRNWTSGKFNDRFRVQLADQPSTTVTSHISKDGHYFIHYDPFQCRSLTVREAARLQTFPDDYLFLGNRTEQYVQVGNAVPPWLARQIAEALLPIYDRI